jgi:hypothetical protein
MEAMFSSETLVFAYKSTRHDVASQNIDIDVFTAVITLNLIHNEEVCNSYSQLYVIRMMKSRIVRRVGRVESMEMRNACYILSEDLKETTWETKA